MGYEIKMLIGREGHASQEHARSTTEKYEDGSGLVYLKDKAGKFVETGRTEIYFSVYAELDLCKLGYQDDALNRLIAKSQKDAGEVSKQKFYYIYDGNEQREVDCYDAHMQPVPIADVLKAVKKSIDKENPYRRLTWAIALLESMAKDDEPLSCMFFGH